MGTCAGERIASTALRAESWGASLWNALHVGREPCDDYTYRDTRSSEEYTYHEATMANGGVVVGGVYCSSGCGYGVGDCLWLQQGRLRSLSREA